MRAKLCFLYYSIQIFKLFVQEKLPLPRYMRKTQKLDKEDYAYENKFKRKQTFPWYSDHFLDIPQSYIKKKGLKYVGKYT